MAKKSGKSGRGVLPREGDLLTRWKDRPLSSPEYAAFRCGRLANELHYLCCQIAAGRYASRRSVQGSEGQTPGRGLRVSRRHFDTAILEMISRATIALKSIRPALFKGDAFDSSAKQEVLGTLTSMGNELARLGTPGATPDWRCHDGVGGLLTAQEGQWVEIGILVDAGIHSDAWGVSWYDTWVGDATGQLGTALLWGGRRRKPESSARPAVHARPS